MNEEKITEIFEIMNSNDKLITYCLGFLVFILFFCVKFMSVELKELRQLAHSISRLVAPCLDGSSKSEQSSDFDNKTEQSKEKSSNCEN